MRPTPRTIAGGVAAAVLGSGVTAALLLGPTTSGAATDTTEPSTDDPTTEETTETGDDAGGFLDDTLAQLVEDGVLTQEEADAIAEAIGDELPPFVMIPVPGQPLLPEGPGRFDREIGPEGGGIHIGPARQNLDTIAEAIGIEPEALLEELRGGATVAEVAEANGVDPQVVIDALVAEYTERVTEWVESGPSTDESSTDESATDEEPSTEDSSDVTDTTVPTTT